MRLILTLVVVLSVSPASAQFWKRTNDFVETVRTSTFDDFPTRPIGTAVDAMLQNAEWQHFVSQSDQNVVEVNGLTTPQLRANALSLAAQPYSDDLRSQGEDYLLLTYSQLMGSQEFSVAYEEIEPGIACGDTRACTFPEQVDMIARSMALMEFNRHGQWRVGEQATLQFVVSEDATSFELLVIDSPAFNGIGIYEFIEAVYAGSNLIR